MNASRFRITFALVLAGLLSAAGVAGLASSTAVSVSGANAGGDSRPLDTATDRAGSTSGGDQAEVRWSSLIPGSFK